MDDGFERLRAAAPEVVEERIRRGDLPENVNWLGLAEVAGADALHGDAAAAFGWARVSIAARRHLAGRAVTSAERRKQEIGVMLLRAELINRHGDVEGDPILDCGELVGEFLARHGATFDVVAEDAGRWRDLPRDRMLELRLVKNELGVLLRVGHCAAVQSAEMRRWLSIRDLLP